MFIYCICTQYLVGAPFALITASIRRGMEVISLWHCWGGMEAQVYLTVAFSSSAFFGLLFLIFLLTIPHRFSISKTLMTMYYKSYIESVLCFSICCWYGNVNVKHRNSLNCIVNQGSKILGIKQTGLSYRFDQFVLQKAKIIFADCTHPLFHEFKMFPSGIRYSMPKLKMNRYRHSFNSHCCKAFKCVGCCVCCLFCLCVFYDMSTNLMLHQKLPSGLIINFELELL